MTKNLESMPAERIVMKKIAVKKVARMVMTMKTARTILTCSQSLTVHLVNMWTETGISGNQLLDSH